MGATDLPGGVTAGYWDTDTSGRAAADGALSTSGQGQSTSALQGPADYAGLYAEWDVDAVWHFGTDVQYPALSLDADGDGRSTWTEMGHQLRTGPAVTAAPGVHPAQVVLTWTEADAGGPRTGSLLVAGERVTVFQASPTVFTDHPIERGVTPVRAIHFLELRARIDVLRAGAGLSGFGWTDPVLTPGVTPIRVVHLTELRVALAENYAAAARPAPVYTNAAPTASASGIRAAHLVELRAAVLALGT